MDTLNYADESLRPEIRTRLAWGVLIFAIVFALLGPFLSVTLIAWVFTNGYSYYISEWKVREYIWFVSILAMLWWLILNLRAIFNNGAAWWKKRYAKYLVPLVISLGLIPLCLVSFEYRGWLVNSMRSRHEVARQKAQRLQEAVRAHLDARAAPVSVFSSRYTPFPDHLAMLVAAGRLAASDLVFDRPGAAVPSGIVEADWGRIAGVIDANCDLIYVGADLEFDQAVSRSYDLLIAYSREPFFHDGYLVVGISSGARFVRKDDFPACWAAHNRQRQALFLPAQMIGVSYPAPPAPPWPPANLVRERARYEAFFKSTGVHPRGLQCAIINYAIDHDGYFPPHPAALIAGKYISPAELIDPSGTTAAYAGDVSRMTEADWPKIEADVERASDFILACADMRIPPPGLSPWAGIATRPASAPLVGGLFREEMREVVLCYSKLVNPREMRVMLTIPWNRELRLAQPYGWREYWGRSNLMRGQLGMASLTPDTAHPNPNGKTTPGLTADVKEMARRNAEVIAAQLKMARDAGENRLNSISQLVAAKRISPRHLKIAGTATVVLSPGDPRIADFPTLTSELNWESQFSDFYLKDVRGGTASAKEVVVYSKSDFGGTGRVYGYFDGTAAFVPN